MTIETRRFIAVLVPVFAFGCGSGGGDLDAGSADAAGGADGAAIDAPTVAVDAAPGTPDAALPDAALPDAALPDAAPPDAALPDATPPCFDMDLGSVLGEGVATGSTVGAGADSGGTCGGGAVPEDVAYLWTAPADGDYTFDLLGSAYDTVLVAFDAACTTELACNDDFVSFFSSLTLAISAGEQVVIVVDGFGASSAGDYVLSITQPTADEVGLCTDGLDNDRDGDRDCLDSDCELAAACIEICTDGIDNDMDGDTDCADSECIGTLVCTETASECGDTFDNDGDGDTDCADPDCTLFSACIEDTPGECTDGLDNDGDTDIDCVDSGCFRDVACDTCPDVFAGTATGADVATGAAPAVNRRRIPFGCSIGEGPEVTVEFTATESGTYTFDTIGSYDTVLYVLNDCNGLSLACDDDSGGSFTSLLDVYLYDGQTVTVVIDSWNATPSGTYHLNITPPAASFLPPLPNAGDIVMTEILFNVEGLEAGREWVELLNVTGVPLSLGGCTFGDLTAIDHVFFDWIILQPGQHYVIAQSLSPGGFVPPHAYDPPAFTLNNGGDVLTLECGGTVIDRVDYGAPNFPGQDGFSIQLDDGSYDATLNDDGENWCNSSLIVGAYDGLNVGSPGEVNESCP